jgi:hypothetical protein
MIETSEMMAFQCLFLAPVSIFIDITFNIKEMLNELQKQK